MGDDVIKETSVEFTSDEAKLQEAKFVIVAVPIPVNTDHTPGDKVHRLENIHKIVSGMDGESLEEIYMLYISGF